LFGKSAPEAGVIFGTKHDIPVRIKGAGCSGVMGDVENQGSCIALRLKRFAFYLDQSVRSGPDETGTALSM